MHEVNSWGNTNNREPAKVLAKASIVLRAFSVSLAAHVTWCLVDTSMPTEEVAASPRWDVSETPLTHSTTQLKLLPHISSCTQHNKQQQSLSSGYWSHSRTTLMLADKIRHHFAEARNTALDRGSVPNTKRRFRAWNLKLRRNQRVTCCHPITSIKALMINQ